MTKQRDFVKGLRTAAVATTEIKNIFEKLGVSKNLVNGLDNMKYIIDSAADEIIRLNATIDAMHCQNLEREENKGNDDD